MNRSEQAIQIAIVDMLELCLPHGWLVHHSALRPRSAVAGAVEKRMGAKAGFPDLIVFGHRTYGFGASVWGIEVKSRSGRLSAEQRAIHDRLMVLGYPIEVCRDIDDVRHMAVKYKWPWREA